MCGTFLFYLREVIDSIPVLMVTREKYVTLKQKEKRERNVKSTTHTIKTAFTVSRFLKKKIKRLRKIIFIKR